MTRWSAFGIGVVVGILAGFGLALVLGWLETRADA